MAASGVAGSEWPWRRRLALTVAVALLVSATLTSWRGLDLLDLETSPREYSIARWETLHFLNKWLYAAGDLFRAEPDADRQTADTARFLHLTGRIDSLATEISDAAQRDQPADRSRIDALHALEQERARLENGVEATVEGRVTAMLRREGLTRDLPLLGATVWPPVDFEFTVPPPVLVTSYRDHIELRGTTLLREDLDLEAIERVEAETERRNDNVSALAFPTGGIGAYPTVVEYTGDYRRLLDVVAHEWMHNYLAFSPLGLHYYASPALRTMNETVASIVGDEVGSAVADAWPLPGVDAPAAQPQPAETPRRRGQRGDTVQVLRDLRAEVDTLLADGKIDEAEALMERRRQELAAQGVYYRKINQAFFAFTNLYSGASGNPGATNPIGPKLDQLRQRSATLADFVRTVRDMTSVADLDRALEAGP